MTASGIRLYKEAIRKDPSLQKAHANLGFALNHLGRYEEALTAIERGLACGDHAYVDPRCIVAPHTPRVTNGTPQRDSTWESLR